MQNSLCNTIPNNNNIIKVIINEYLKIYDSIIANKIVNDKSAIAILNILYE